MANTIIADAVRRHQETVQASANAIMPDAERAAELLLSAFKSGHKLLVCGNGGSAADSQHFAAEFVCKYKKERRELPALALTVNSSVITATGNDYDFDRVFVRQIQALGNEGDVLVAISTSGTSKNVVAGIAEAKTKGIHVIAMTGEGGAALKDKVDVLIAVPSKETARVQEVHELIYHAWCEYIDEFLA